LIIENKKLTGERALFRSKNAIIENCTFCDGESPLKHSQAIEVKNSTFLWRYPLWYCHDLKVNHSSFNIDTRAGFWYSNRVTVTDTKLESPKNFRHCNDLTLNNVIITGGEETLWSCENVNATNLTSEGNYFCKGTTNAQFDGLKLVGKYSFDDTSNITIVNSYLDTKDPFWNSHDIIVKDSYIKGEYIGWNSKNLTFINCTIESLQGFCYIDNLKLINCKLPNTSYAFEYCSVDAEIIGKIDSILNPKSGVIKADEIGTLILEENEINTNNVIIDCKKINEKQSIVSWRNNQQ